MQSALSLVSDHSWCMENCGLLQEVVLYGELHNKMLLSLIDQQNSKDKNNTFWAKIRVIDNILNT